MAAGWSAAGAPCGGEGATGLLPSQVDLLPEPREEVLHGGVVDQVQHQKHRAERHREGYEGSHSSHLARTVIDRTLEEDHKAWV